MAKKLPSTDRSLPIALIRAREGVMAPIRDMLAETGLTEQQWRVLRVLAEDGPRDASGLARRSGLLVPSLTRILQTMSKRGLITQSKDKTDRRRQVVTITEAGSQIIAENEAQAAQIARGFREHLGPDNHDRLLDLLAMLDPHRTT